MYKRFISILVLVFFISSCGGAWQDVKRGVTGQKRQSADEFLIQKKDPLVLPPDFENLPTPDERSIAKEEFKVFENNTETLNEDSSSVSSSTEENILRKIQSQ